MTAISGYNCSQEEAAICDACSEAIDDSYVIKLLNETMGPQTVSTLYINNIYMASLLSYIVFSFTIYQCLFTYIHIDTLQFSLYM